MYLYFDNNGILKEIVDDVATRKGNNEVNRLYIYVDGITPKTEWITYQTSDNVQSNETLIETTITKTIPYDRNRDLKYFKNFQEYLFYVATIPSNVLAVSGLTKASVRVALQDDSLMTLGLIIFTIEDSVVLQDSFITESQYQYLLNIISNFEELNNTGVIGITTQIVNGAVSPYDQGRIVLSTYNDNFTIATVVKSSAGQNIYNVLDMTFVKQVPFNSNNPNLEGLEINGKKYKVAFKTSQLNNDANFITNAVSNLINYYDKNTVDEKLSNIDLSEYYTKTESDRRYVLTTNFSWNNLANKPTSLSDFINDEGFITNTVSNLTNYYDKNTIDTIVATLKTGAFQVVNELPSSGTEGIVYLVGTEAPYTMYIWENNAFLNIGTTEVNLDGYVKGTNLNTNYVILGNGGSNVVASSYTINNQNANDPNSLLTAKVINTLLGTKQDVLTQGQGINISDNVISTPVSTTSTTIAQQSVNKLKYDGKPILVDYAVNDDSGRNIVDTYATINDLHTLDIGDITSSSNIYQTLYQNVYENDTTKKNVVIFSTDGFVDSATSLISSGEHIATPYRDNEILIDSVFVLNSDNSATSIVSSDTVVIDLGTFTGESGTLSPDIVSKINSAISENKNIVIKAVIEGTTIFPNVIYAEGLGLFATGFMSMDTEISSISIMIELPAGQYTLSILELQVKLDSGTNIKTINNQSILGEGNLEIGGSNFQIIDVSSDGNLKSIAAISDAIRFSKSLNFTNQSVVYNNIATAINNGLIPILKFIDGYGYYKGSFSSSRKYNFTLNFISNTTHSPYITNNIITLRVDSSQNNASLDDLGKIPNTVIINSNLEKDSGSLSADETSKLTQALNKAKDNASAGIFISTITNDSYKKHYYISKFQLSPTNSLIAYTITQDNVEVLNLTLSGEKFNYTKSTYALGGGGGESNNIIIDLGTLSATGGTLSSEILTQINNNLGNKNITFKANIDLGDGYLNMVSQTYQFVSGNFLAISMTMVVDVVYDPVSVIAMIISLQNGTYATSTISLPREFATNDELNALFNYELPLTTEKSTALWLGVGQALQTFVNSSKSESDKATLKEALRLGLGVPFCYIFASNSISSYDTYLDNVVNYFANATLTSQNVSQIISYISESNTIITSIGNDATITSAPQKNQIYNYINSICNVLNWTSNRQTTSITISTASGETLIVFTTNTPIIPNKTISLENLNAFKQQIENEINNEIGNVLVEEF